MADWMERLLDRCWAPQWAAKMAHWMASSSIVNSGEHWAGMKGWRLVVQMAAMMDDSQAVYWGES